MHSPSHSLLNKQNFLAVSWFPCVSFLDIILPSAWGVSEIDSKQFKCSQKVQLNPTLRGWSLRSIWKNFFFLVRVILKVHFFGTKTFFTPERSSSLKIIYHYPLSFKSIVKCQASLAAWQSIQFRVMLGYPIFLINFMPPINVTMKS